MTTLHELLGVDPTSPESLRAEFLAENDRALLQALVHVRAENRLTQSEVAARMGVTQPTVADFESHDSNPTLSRIRRYAHAVGALISHRVELDSGQLLDDRRHEWMPASITVRVAARPSPQAPVEVRSEGRQMGSFRPARLANDCPDLALAA